MVLSVEISEKIENSLKISKVSKHTKFLIISGKNGGINRPAIEAGRVVAFREWQGVGHGIVVRGFRWTFRTGEMEQETSQRHRRCHMHEVPGAQ